MHQKNFQGPIVGEPGPSLFRVDQGDTNTFLRLLDHKNINIDIYTQVRTGGFYKLWFTKQLLGTYISPHRAWKQNNIISQLLLRPSQLKKLEEDVSQVFPE